MFVYVFAFGESHLKYAELLIKSLTWVGNKHDVIAFYWNLDPVHLLRFANGYRLRLIPVSGSWEHEPFATAIYRFKGAYDYGKQYDAVCLLDADQIVVKDPTIFFKIAKNGFIVAGHNGMCINFDRKYQAVENINLGQSDCVYLKTHGNSPFFCGKKDLDLFKCVYDSWRPDGLGDFLLHNMLGIKMGKSKRLIAMPPYTFTGLHHYQVKPESGILEINGSIYSGTREFVYMLHGKWLDDFWIMDMRNVAYSYADEYGMPREMVDWHFNCALWVISKIQAEVT